MKMRVAGYLTDKLTLFCFFRIGFQNLKSPSRQTSGFTLGAMAGIFVILIHSVSDFNLNIPVNTFAFTIIAAIATKNYLRQSEQIRVPHGRLGNAKPL